MPSCNDRVIRVTHLFPTLDKKLLELLRGLTPAEWEMPTIAKLWRVKDIASHLLDGNLRTLSTSRDGFSEIPDVNIANYQDLVGFLNQLNADWTKATRRISPQVLIELLELTGKLFCEHMAKADLSAEAIFPVSWAGETTSVNWFHIAREYTEKWIHQQQIRDAVGKQDLFSKELFYPMIDTLMQALPHAYKDLDALTGTAIKIEIDTAAGGIWFLNKEDIGWCLSSEIKGGLAAEICMDPHTAWKVFSKGISPEEARSRVLINGNKMLAENTLRMVAVMA